MGWALPENPNPPDTVCIQARVPNDPAYIDAFWGAILDLGAGFKWADDSAHTAILASRRMRQMYYEMVENNCVPPPNLIQSPCSDCCEGCMAVRWNGCTLEEYDCSIQAWIPVQSINQPCVSNPAPGGGVTPPGPGGCQKYGLQFYANALTVMPFVVNTGDTIQVLSEVGAGTDGTVNWYCPDGSFFIAGACAGGGAPLVGDPLVGANHMSVVIKIGSAYYPLVSGTFVVPSSIVNQQVYIGVNDATLSDNSGIYGIDFQYCNNATPVSTPFCRFLDFTLSPYFGVGSTDPDSNGHHHPNPYWVVGSGWQADTTLIPPSTTYENEPRITFDLGSPVQINYVQVDGNVAVSASGVYQVAVQASNDPTFATGVVAIVPSIFPPSGSSFSAGGAVSPVTYRYLRLYCDTYSHPAASTPSVVFSQLTVKGMGAVPAIGVAC